MLPLALEAQDSWYFPARDPVWLLPPLYWIAAAALLAAIAVWLLARIWRRIRARRTIPPPATTPYEEARRALEAARDEIREGNHDAFVMTVSRILRRYIERALHVPAQEQTTEEFLAAAVEHPMLAGDLSDRLARFLAQCDLVKFARQPINPQTMMELIDAAAYFVEETGKHREEVPVDGLPI